MNKRIKTIALAVLLMAGITFTTHSQMSDIRALQESLMNLSEDFAKSLPFNASLGLNWADSYIGKFIPSIPPHFGVGASFGFTTADMPSVKTVVDYLGYTIPNDSKRLKYPGYTIEGRMGGILFPLDVGLKFGYLPYKDIPGNEIDLYSLLVGGDVRFVVIDGKSDRSRPNVSLGFGLNYLRGGVEGSSKVSKTLSFGPANLKLENPDVDLKWSCFSLDLKGQVSKTFAIFTPYLGIGGSYGWSTVKYSVDADVTVNSRPIDQAYINVINILLDGLGLQGMELSQSGISSSSKDSAFNLRFFGGFSVNLSIFRLDLTGLYTPMGNNYGFGLGARMQI